MGTADALMAQSAVVGVGRATPGMCRVASPEGWR